MTAEVLAPLTVEDETNDRGGDAVLSDGAAAIGTSPVAHRRRAQVGVATCLLRWDLGRMESAAQPGALDEPAGRE